MKNQYQQCRLVKNNAHQVCWIPVSFAQIGRHLKLKKDGVWDDGWVVDEVYHTIIDRPIYLDKMVREHEKRTGDSLR